MKYEPAVKTVKGEKTEYIKAIPENAADCFELFLADKPMSKKDMDCANSALRVSLENLFAKSAHVSADNLNHSLHIGDAEFERLRSAHQLNAAKAYNAVEQIIFGKRACLIDLLDMNEVKAFADGFAVLFRGRFTNTDISAFALKRFSASSFRECCALFAGFETRRRSGEEFVSAAIVAADKKMSKNARKRAARAAAAHSPEYAQAAREQIESSAGAMSYVATDEHERALAEAANTRMCERLNAAKRNAEMYSA